MRIALLTLESTATSAAAARVLRETPHDIVFLGLSDAYAHSLANTWRRWRRSGWRILPWLFVEFAAPRLFRRGDGPLGEAARARGIEPRVVADVNGEATRAALAAARPDLIVTCHFDQILAEETIALAPLGGINLHPSLLPRHRGPMPCFWAAKDGDGAFGVTVHRLVARIDAGAVLAQRAVAMPPGATVSAAARALHDAGVGLLLATIEDIAAGREQPATVATLPYCPFPTPRDLACGVRLTGWDDYRAARALGGAIR